MSTTPFHCSMAFADSWKATREEISGLLSVLVESLTSEAGVSHLEIFGSLDDGGLLDLTFSVEDDDSLTAMGMVVRALNLGRVSAPGWPDDDVIDGAIGSVTVRRAELVTT